MTLSQYFRQAASWLLRCFGDQITYSRTERNQRFLEEALEVVQACGMTETEVKFAVQYVYSRPVGEPSQEVGGVMVCLAGLCLANDIDFQKAALAELARINQPEIIEKIREKQKTKPRFDNVPI